MGRYATYPLLFDEANTLSVNFLKQHGYLDLNNPKEGVITWTSRNYGTKSEIGIKSIYFESMIHSIELSYRYDKEPRKLIVRIEFVPSNLGTGEIPYFRCPKTFKRCKKLHCIHGWFYHRTAFKYCYYDSQIVSKKFRSYTHALNLSREIGQLYSKRYQKHRKTHYRGKKTKVVEQLDKQIELANYGSGMFERLLLM